MFRGRTTVSLDAKGRLAVPSRYRERLAESYDNALVLTPSPYDPCLWLYPLREWELIEEKLARLPDHDRATRRMKQILRGAAEDVTLDSQGRVLIPQHLRERGGLDRMVTILGEGSRFELWDEARWKEVEAGEDLASLGTGDAPPSLRDFSFN